MSGDLTTLAAAILAAAFRFSIREPNIESGFEGFVARTGHPVTYEAFCDAVAACLRDGLIREPIRLPEGALQCHWHLELTPKGVAAARALPRDIGGGAPLDEGTGTL